MACIAAGIERLRILRRSGEGSCLPGEAGIPAAEAVLADFSELGVYLDVSQSSTNFGRGNGASAYRDLIAWLLNLGEISRRR